MNSSFFSAQLIGPRACSATRMVSLPPAISLVSGGIIRIITKYRAMDIRMDQGAAAISQSLQVMVWP